MVSLVTIRPTLSFVGISEIFQFFAAQRMDRTTRFQLSVQDFYNGKARKFVKKRDYMRSKMSEGSWSQRVAIALFLNSPYGSFARKHQSTLTEIGMGDWVNSLVKLDRRINRLRKNILLGRVSNNQIQAELSSIGSEAGYSLMPWLHRVGFTPAVH